MLVCPSSFDRSSRTLGYLPGRLMVGGGRSERGGDGWRLAARSCSPWPTCGAVTPTPNSRPGSASGSRPYAAGWPRWCPTSSPRFASSCSSRRTSGVDRRIHRRRASQGDVDRRRDHARAATRLATVTVLKTNAMTALAATVRRTSREVTVTSVVPNVVMTDFGGTGVDQSLATGHPAQHHGELPPDAAQHHRVRRPTARAWHDVSTLAEEAGPGARRRTRRSFRGTVSGSVRRRDRACVGRMDRHHLVLASAGRADRGRRLLLDRLQRPRAGPGALRRDPHRRSHRRRRATRGLGGTVDEGAEVPSSDDDGAAGRAPSGPSTVSTIWSTEAGAMPGEARCLWPDRWPDGRVTDTLWPKGRQRVRAMDPTMIRQPMTVRTPSTPPSPAWVADTTS